MITKKLFKEQISQHSYTGGGNRINAFYYNHKRGDGFNGFKFAVYADTKDCSKAELLNLFYDWVHNKLTGDLPPYVHYRLASEDKFRFKVPLSLSNFYGTKK